MKNININEVKIVQTICKNLSSILPIKYGIWGMHVGRVGVRQEVLLLKDHHLWGITTRVQRELSGLFNPIPSYKANLYCTLINEDWWLCHVQLSLVGAYMVHLSSIGRSFCSFGRTSGKLSPFPLCAMRISVHANLATHMHTLYFQQFSPLMSAWPSESQSKLCHNF